MRKSDFRKTTALATAFAAMFVFALVTPAGASSRSSIKVTPDSLLIGDTATVTGRGFKPRSKFVLKVNDVKVASGTTSKRGRVALTFVVPDGSLNQLEFKLTSGSKTASTIVIVTDGVARPDDNGDGSGDVQEDDPNSTDPGDHPPEFNF